MRKEIFKKIVGRTSGDARRILEDDGMVLRVVKVDGIGMGGTQDVLPNRVNVAVVNDVVVDVLDIG